MKRYCVYVFLIIVFQMLSFAVKAQRIIGKQRDVKFTLLMYPRKSFYRELEKKDTIYAETYFDSIKTILIYKKKRQEEYELVNSFGILKEIGNFRKYRKGFLYKRDLTYVKIGLWNYYDDRGVLIRVMMHKGRLSDYGL